MYLLRKGHKKPYAQQGDIMVSQDERSAYTVAKDGSLRRIKDKDALTQVMDKFREMKKELETREAAEAEQRRQEQEAAEHPLTSVNPRTNLKVASLLAMTEAMAPGTMNRILGAA